MRAPFVPRLATLLLACAPPCVQAATVARIDIRGLDEAMTQNVRDALSLGQAVGKDVSGRRLSVLMRAAEDEARGALEPFGYYDPKIDVARSGAAGAPVVTITVDPGQPVRVRGFSVVVAGAGGADADVRADIAAFQPKPGAVFEHAPYEAGKARISRSLARHGYFDAELTRHRVEVTRAAHAADIDLAWASGARYAFGSARFTQAPSIIRPQLLANLVPWQAGDAFDQAQVERLRESLQRLDYFGRIEVTPQPDAAKERVPVDVQLTPARRSIYTAGLSYGTTSGSGVRLGVERRYLNSRGHKALAQIDWAQQRKTLTLQYRIPAFAWLDGWYTLGAQAADEQNEYIDTRRVELVASRSGELNPHLTATASLHALRERWAYVATARSAVVDYRYATFTYPALQADYVDVDDRLFPRAGASGTLLLRSASRGLGSDASFLQAHARVNWFQGLGARDRLILRGELGHTFTGALVDMPPSLRFYAGGDRSIRGYNDREVGPRLGRFALGARNVVTASAEVEHYLTDQWGMAAFVDGGSAFDGRVPDWHTGVGVGVRWRSPVGPVRLDIGRGLDHPDSPFTIHLNIGTEL